MKDLLDVPRFSTLKSLTSINHLEHKVDSIEITETPDVAFYIPENAFILTTAMIYKDNQTQLIPLIDSLKRANSAGLGIKVGRFIDKIDQPVLDYANELSFPIIQIPNTVPLGSLLHQLLNYIWNTKTEQLSYALDIQKRFSTLLMNDASYARFIAEFGKLVKTPVILLDPFRKVVAHSKHFSHSSKPAEYFVNQIIQRKQQWKANETDAFLIKDTDDIEAQISVYPVQSNNHFPFYLLILRPEQIPYPISEFAIDQACLVLSFIIFKNEKVDESLKILKSDYFAELVETQQSTQPKQKDWIELGSKFGMHRSNYYQVVYVNCINKVGSSTSFTYQEEMVNLAAQWLDETLPAAVRDTVVFRLKNTTHLAILFQKKQEDVESILEATLNDLSEAMPIQLAFSFGNAHESVDKIGNSYIESKLAYEESSSMDHQPTFYYYHHRGMINLFERVESEEVHYFCQTILKDLAYPKEDSLIELRKTLQAYLDFQCEIAKTAKKLFIHRNTVKYRIDHCETILGTPIADPTTSLSLRLALSLSQKDTDY